MSTKKRGLIKKYFSDKGFGFIAVKNSKDIYFNKREVLSNDFSEGDTVEFIITQGQKGPQASKVMVVADEITEFLKENVLNLEDADYDQFCDTVKEYAEKLKDGGLTTSKIRKIYSRITNTKSPGELKLLRPQFAYTAGRSDSRAVKEFMDLLDYLVKKMVNNDQIQHKKFLQFMEAVVAYRKYAGDDK